MAHAQTIVTPEDQHEHMPVVFPGGARIVMLDGHLYNRERLINALYLPNYTRGEPDSAILRAALERWGEEVCAHLEGDFAFASWQPHARRLFLACDHTGGRSLYYSTSPRGLAFATSVHAVLDFPGVACELDEESLARLLLDGTPRLEHTLYRGVRQLPSAGRLTWTPHRLRVERYWQLDFTRRLTLKHDEDYVEAGRELLDRAVACRLRSLAPVACLLSGGLDSPAVAGTAARLLAPVPFLTVTACMEPALPLPPSTSHFFYDEWPHVEAMARLHPNLVTHACPAGVMADEMYPVRLFHARGQPIRNLINIAWFGAASAKVRALGASVLLTGHSGNYTLSYDGRAWFMDLAASGRLLRLWCEIQDLAQQGLSRWAELRRVGATVAPAWCRMLMRRLRGRAAPWWYFSAIHPGFAADLHAARLLQDIRPAQREHGWNADVWRLGLERTWRARDMQAAMRPYYGYETRDPLGDVRLIEFCIALPPEQYVRHGVTRFLARRVLADRVPPQITQERRHGLQNPQWFSRLSRHRSAMAEALELLQQSPLARRVLDLPRLQALMHAWPTNADTAQFLPLVAILSRGINIGQFIQWVENGRPL